MKRSIHCLNSFTKMLKKNYCLSQKHENFIAHTVFFSFIIKFFYKQSLFTTSNNYIYNIYDFLDTLIM